MEQQVELKSRDYAGWLLMLPLRERFFLVTTVAMWALPTAYSLFTKPFESAHDVLVMFVANALLFWPALAVFWAIFSVFYAKWSGAQTGPHRFRLSDEGLEEENQSGRLITNWSNVKNIRLTRGSLIIGLKGMRYHILPRRCFTDEELHSFYRAVKAYLGQPDDFPRKPTPVPPVPRGSPPDNSRWKSGEDDPWR